MLEKASAPAEGPAEEGSSAASGPPGWPKGVPLPGADGFEHAVIAWLFDLVPPDYRKHAVLARYPDALAVAARHHLALAEEVTTAGRRGAAVELKGWLEPHAVEGVHEVYRAELARIARCRAGVELLLEALRDPS